MKAYLQWNLDNGNFFILQKVFSIDIRSLLANDSTSDFNKCKGMADELPY